MPESRRQRTIGYIVALVLVVLEVLPLGLAPTAAKEGFPGLGADSLRDAAIWVPLLSLALMVFLWSQLGKSRKVSFHVDYLREPPYTYGPAVVGWLSRFGRAGLPDIVATMMHLVRRGALEMNKIDAAALKANYECKRVRNMESGLASYEKELLDYIFGMIAVSDHMTFKDIQNFADYYPQRISRFLKRWSKSIADEANKYDFIEKPAPVWLALNLTMAAVTATLGAIVVQVNALQGSLALVIGAAQFGSTYLMKRRTLTGEIHYQRWLAFKRFLTDFSSVDAASPQAVVIWENYLIYALSLGVAGEVKRQLQIAPFLDTSDSGLFDSIYTGVELVHE